MTNYAARYFNKAYRTKQDIFCISTILYFEEMWIVQSNITHSPYNPCQLNIKVYSFYTANLKQIIQSISQEKNMKF